MIKFEDPGFLILTRERLDDLVVATMDDEDQTVYEAIMLLHVGDKIDDQGYLGVCEDRENPTIDEMIFIIEQDLGLCD